MHLTDDNALCAIDNEGTVGRHERHVAHIDVLFLDVLHGAGSGLFVHIKDDQSQSHLKRRGKGHSALLAFLDVVFRIFEFVMDEFQLGAFGKIRNRKNGFEHSLKTLFRPTAFGILNYQKLIIGMLLHLDQVGHCCHFQDAAKLLPYASATRKVVLRHGGSSSRSVTALPNTHEALERTVAIPVCCWRESRGRYMSGSETPLSKSLLDFDGCARFLKFLLKLFGLVFGDAILD